MAKPIITAVSVDIVEAPVEVTEVAVAAAGTVIATEADTYASIAAAHKPAKLTKHEYAVALYELNGGKALAAGVTVTL